MTMQCSIEADLATAESVGCARDLLIAALAIIDDMQLPGEIGAHLDLTIHKLGNCLAGSDGATLDSLPT